ncbi:MAG: hypothetical protein EOP53_05365 [Sphingobacteriales bacterium]|nr:MAG: hypothetical protein EOP53_05365 [Sphingobacteriales bacterium]
MSGSDLENATIFYQYTSNSVDSASGEEFIDLYNNFWYNIATSEKFTPNGNFWIKLIEKPTPNTPQQFAIEIELIDGRILRDTTVKFFVK